jgi:hypothetical protein
VAVEVVARADTPAIRRAIGASLRDHDVPLVELRVATDRRALRQPLPLRCDLKEGDFGGAALPLELPTSDAEASRRGG